MAKNLDGRAIDPVFDGHAERPFDAMSPAEKLDYIGERAVDLHWAESVRAKDQPSGPPAKVEGKNAGERS